MSIGMAHALLLRDTLRQAGEDGWAFAELFDEATERDLKPWFDAQQATDRARYAHIDARRAGRAPPPPADPLTRDLQALRAGMIADPDLFRCGLEYLTALAPAQQILARPGLRERVYAAAAEVAKAPPRSFPAPTRDQLEALAAA
jgi:hypothetical protein